MAARTIKWALQSGFWFVATAYVFLNYAGPQRSDAEDAPVRDETLSIDVSPLADSCITTQNDTSRHDNLLKYVRHIIREHQLPAAAAFTTHCGITNFFSATAGVRRRWTSVNATAYDHWHLGSNTKSMTATILAMLIQDGLLAWESTLGDLLPDIEMLPKYVSVSVADLTSHHSGLSDEQLTILAAQSYSWNATTGRQHVTLATLTHPSTSTRGSFLYSNVNYVLAGLLIDRLTGTPAEDVFEARFFSALKLGDPGFGPLPEPSSLSTCQPWPHVAVPGYLGRFAGAIPYFGPVKYRDNPPVFNTAGRVHMRMWQYALYLNLITQGAQGTGIKSLNLTADSAQALTTVVGEADEMGCKQTIGGWRRCEDNGEGGFILAHEGSNTRYYASAVIDVAANRTYAAFTNRGDEAAKMGVESLVGWMRAGMYWTEGTEHDENGHSEAKVAEEL